MTGIPMKKYNVILKIIGYIIFITQKPKKKVQLYDKLLTVIKY